MALIAGCGLFIIERVLPRVASRERMLSIARMSMNWDVDDVVRHLEKNGVDYQKKHEKRIRSGGPSYSSRDFYKLLGFKHYDDVDLHASEGCTIVHDLNQPIPEPMRNRYGFVVEVGTIEHIFDTKTVMHNISGAVSEGGIVCHLAPLDAFNHGFYNFSLNFFYDFYAANGFTEMESFIIRSSSKWATNQNVLVEPMPYTHEEFYVNKSVYTSEYDKMGIGFVAKKAVHVPEVVVPLQASYDPNRSLDSRLRNF